MKSLLAKLRAFAMTPFASYLAVLGVAGYYLGKGKAPDIEHAVTMAVLLVTRVEALADGAKTAIAKLTPQVPPPAP